MLTVKAKIPAHADYEPILPLAVPELKEVKAFANHLHSLGKHWEGEVFGWQNIPPKVTRNPWTQGWHSLPPISGLAKAGFGSFH